MASATAPAMATPTIHPAMNANPFALALGVMSINTMATIGIGLIATPSAKGSSWPIASPMGTSGGWGGNGYRATDPRTSMTPGDETRAALIEAAERLMAERGVYAVDLKEIMTVAGARNRSAVQYHFGGREGLVRAIGAKHRSPINE